jgi:hypothetical protein
MSSCDCWKTHGKSCVCAKKDEQANWVLVGLFVCLVSFLAYKSCRAEDKSLTPPARVEQTKLIRT